jgi:hypothetical protein
MQVRRGNGLSIRGAKREPVSVLWDWCAFCARKQPGFHFPPGRRESDRRIKRNQICVQHPPARETGLPPLTQPDGESTGMRKPYEWDMNGCPPQIRNSCLKGCAVSRRSGPA